ncbi:MAG TPA: hypothetical protein PKM58_00825 [Pyrinomonadaceae bacterium]|nr:hypothetical protein [Pyrinomonadaceae bacterium]HNU06507.1 hypothetical protein [Pyrinomonadaceae bacterium]
MRKRFKVFTLLFVFAAVLIIAVSASAQSTTFSNENVDYTFELPNPTWKMVSEPSKIKPNVEYVFGDRNSGYLEVRKLSVKADSTMADIIGDEETKLRFVQGYVAGREEQFAGNLRGTVFNYEYIRSGRTMSGRMYFLRADSATIYTIRFTGYKEKLLSIRNQTDSIARTFQVRK